MARRVSLPAVDDLFRPTSAEAEEPAVDSSRPRRVRAVADASSNPDAGQAERRPSGRVRHDEKMTVYMTAEELLEIEHARLTLRRSHGVVVDRGRLVREALALVLADLEAKRDDSALVRRLTEE